MRTLFFIIFLFIARYHSAQPFEYHSENIIIKFKEGIQYEDADINKRNNLFEKFNQLNTQYGLKSLKPLNPKAGSDIYLLSFSPSQNIPEVIRDYGLLKIIDYIEPDYKGYGGGVLTKVSSIAPNDYFFNRQWGLANDGSFSLSTPKSGADINIQDAWAISQGSADVIIASLDSGVKLDHPELESRIWRNPGESEDGLDNDQNGYLDDLIGWDFANNDNLPKDDYGHGTNVTGIIGSATNNSIGYAGVNWNSPLMILKILDKNNSGYYSWWIEAIYYAVNNGANVINMSVGGSSYSSAMRDAIKYAVDKNVVVVACMMNENNDMPYYPAAYPETIAVGSTDPNDERSDRFPWDSTKGSNYGNHIDLTAPGNYIYGLSYLNDSNFNSYWAGTSQATPLVTGVVSLMQSINPNLKPEEIKQQLRATADDKVGRIHEDIEGWDKFHGAGRLNAFNALSGITTSAEHIVIKEKERFIYPNPLSKNEPLFIKNNASEDLYIEIVDLSGNSLYKNYHSQNPIVIRPNFAASGSYILHVRNKDNESYFEKFILY